MSTAQLNNYRQSPRKVRLVADVVRGKKVKEVFPILDNLSKRAAEPIKKLLKSAIANAVHNENLEKDELVVSEIRVDEGVTLKRWRPRARGRAFPIRKRTSRVMVCLKEIQAIKEKKPVVKKIEEKEKPASAQSLPADRQGSDVAKPASAESFGVAKEDKDSVKDKNTNNLDTIPDFIYFCLFSSDFV